MYKSTKHRIHRLLHPEVLGNERWDKFINIFIIVLIVLNVVAVMLETVPGYHDEWAEQRFFHYFDLFSVIIFTIEYFLRLWSSDHDPKYRHPIWGRLRYMLTPSALIDLLAFLPFYLVSVFAFDLRIIRLFRLLRFLRIFQLTAYLHSTRMIVNVFKKRSNELILSTILMIFLIIIASSAVYFAEHLHPINKDNFTSIPASIWWAIVTLTTTGYGDMIPMTLAGKIASSIIMLSGVAIFALPAGIITAGFLDEFRGNNKQKPHCPHCGKSISLEEMEHKDHS
jgi:voltage-gated potassium channel